MTLKFRAWSNHEKRMYYLSNSYGDDMHIEASNHSWGVFDGTKDRAVANNHYGDTLMSWIGRSDKNGTEIYDNDIVKTKHGRFCLVNWKETPSFIGFDLSPIESTNKNPDEYDLWKSENLEVVGNRFENSELLK